MHFQWESLSDATHMGKVINVSNTVCVWGTQSLLNNTIYRASGLLPGSCSLLYHGPTGKIEEDTSCAHPSSLKFHSKSLASLLVPTSVYQAWIQISERHFTSHDVISSLHVTALVPISRELLTITTQLFLWSWDTDQNSFHLWHSCKLEEPFVICTGQQI